MPYKYISVAEVATYVRHTGRTMLPGDPPDLSQGETLLLLHGAGGNQGVYDGVFDRLGDRHSAVAFDQPGHGRSGSLDSLGNIDAMAKFTRELVGALGIVKPVVLGHSMGGAVAMQYALTYPDALKALVISASATRFDGIDATRLVAEGKARRPFVREMYAHDTKPEIMQRGFMEDLKTDPRAQLGDYIACRDWSGDHEIEAIAVPTLVVRGEHEYEASMSSCDELVRRIDGARLVVIPGAGHKLPIEQPEALTEAVVRFLAEIAE
jgi:pimeloyl-ACP methyl ester carboxylesterase